MRILFNYKFWEGKIRLYCPIPKRGRRVILISLKKVDKSIVFRETRVLNSPLTALKKRNALKFLNIRLLRNVEEKLFVL